MIKINKVYTKKGDDGTTVVLGPNRIPKDSQEIIVLGLLDELNAYIGWTRVSFANEQFQQLSASLLAIQNQLFDLGAFLCRPSKSLPSSVALAITKFENEIDDLNQNLSPLNSFVLPGANEQAARLHIARTICRRTEVNFISLAKDQSLLFQAIPYLNRLSDWLFVAARYVAKISGDQEFLWQPDKK